MNKKKLGGLLAGLLGAAGVIARLSQSHHAPPAPPAGPTRHTMAVVVADGSGQPVPGVVITTDPALSYAPTNADGYTATVAEARHYRVAAALDGWHGDPVDVDLTGNRDVRLTLTRDLRDLPRLSTDGHIFRADGQPFRWKGVSSFQLLDRFARGEDISDVLNAYKGFNVLRVWPYVPKADWGASAWDAPSQPVVLEAFLQRVRQAGFYVELTLLTDDDSARLDQARALLAAMKAANPPNLLIEIGNEPTTHKNINTAALKSTAAWAGFLTSSGNYEDTRLFYGSWLGFHSGRDGDWPRRAHDAIDYWNGGGPDFPEEPSVRVPSVCDEPIRPDQAGYNAQDFRAYFGACAAMAAGATYHTETGKFGQPPTPEEARIAAVVLDALNAFPADAAQGSYRRIDEGGKTLRTYVIGERAMIRVRPTTKDAPESGWTALDAEGVLWKR